MINSQEAILDEYRSDEYVWTHTLHEFWHSIEIFNKEGKLLSGIGCGVYKNGQIVNPNVQDAIDYIKIQNNS